LYSDFSKQSIICIRLLSNYVPLSLLFPEDCKGNLQRKRLNIGLDNDGLNLYYSRILSSRENPEIYGLSMTDGLGWPKSSNLYGGS
jgi:hypothetical protein